VARGGEGQRAEAKQAWTDVARFSEAGVNAVNFGPGETAQAHQRDESCSVQALADAYQTPERFLRAPACSPTTWLTGAPMRSAAAGPGLSAPLALGNTRSLQRARRVTQCATQAPHSLFAR
jgi:hypothetical protein